MCAKCWRRFLATTESSLPGEIKEAPPGFEPGVADLQSAALPLGEGANHSLSYIGRGVLATVRLLTKKRSEPGGSGSQDFR